MGYLLIVSVTMSCVLLLSLLTRLFYWAWWKPMKLEKLFKDQGIVGPPYRLLIGNIMEDVRSIKEAWSKPMNLSHQIVPRVVPFIHQIVKKYGISYLSLTLIFFFFFCKYSHNYILLKFLTITVTSDLIMVISTEGRYFTTELPVDWDSLLYFITSTKTWGE